MEYDDGLPATKGDLRRHADVDRGQFDAIGSTLKIIQENHLAHIQSAQERQDTNIKWIMWLLMGLATGVGTIALTVVLNLLK